MPTFRHGAATIYYEEFGQGFPVLTFAPAGLQSTIEGWSRPAAPINPTIELAASFRVIAMGQRNAGGRSHAPISARDGWDTYTGDHLDALSRNLYESGFVYCVDREFVSSYTTPCLVLAGNAEAHPLPFSEDLAGLLPKCELVREWKTEPALTLARTRVQDFLAKHTPRGS